jgi:hypothetical protein
LRAIKLALLSIIFHLLVMTAFSLLIPSHIRISKAINIGAQDMPVFALIKDTAAWKRWHPAFIPNDAAPKFAPIHFTLQSQSDSEITMLLQQGKKEAVLNGWKLYGHAGADSLTLQWYMDFHLKWYPWKKFGSLFYENTYGVMMQEGLENIRRLSSKQPGE